MDCHELQPLNTNAVANVYIWLRALDNWISEELDYFIYIKNRVHNEGATLPNWGVGVTNFYADAFKAELLQFDDISRKAAVKNAIDCLGFIADDDLFKSFVNRIEQIESSTLEEFSETQQTFTNVIFTLAGFCYKMEKQCELYNIDFADLGGMRVHIFVERASGRSRWKWGKIKRCINKYARRDVSISSTPRHLPPQPPADSAFADYLTDAAAAPAIIAKLRALPVNLPVKMYGAIVTVLIENHTMRSIADGERCAVYRALRDLYTDGRKIGSKQGVTKYMCSPKLTDLDRMAALKLIS